MTWLEPTETPFIWSLRYRNRIIHALTLTYIDTTTDRSVMENLVKDISEMSLLYIDEEAIQVFEEIGQGKHSACNFTTIHTSDV